jgi:hypothetical protein
VHKAKSNKSIWSVIAILTSLLMVSSGNLVGQAYQTQDLLVYVDAGNTDSYDPASSGVWRDLSVNGRNGTINNPGKIELLSGALKFNNTGLNSTSGAGAGYVDMGSGFDNFSGGITIEVEAHFGARGVWERIFDFGNGASNDNFWLGRYENSDEIAVEIWSSTTNRGRCKTKYPSISTESVFRKYVVTLSGSECRIYVDGTQVETVIVNPFGSLAPDPTTDGLGSKYETLPNNVLRTQNYIGKSNWTGDAAFEGAIKYVRIYDTPLSAQSIEQNTNSDTPSFTITYSTTGSDSGSAPSQFTGSGSVTLASNSGNLEKDGYEFIGWATTANQTTAISNSYTLAANVTLYPVFRVEGSSDGGGGGGGGGGTPAEPTLQVISPDQTNGANQPARVNPGKPHTIFGNGLDAVTGLLIGDRKIDIRNKAKDRLQFNIPKNLPAGKYRIQLVGNFGTVTQQDFFEVARRKITQNSFGFLGDSPRLTSPIRASVKNLMGKLPGQVTLVCEGSTSNTVATSFDRKLAAKRAKEACGLARQINPDIETKIKINPASGLGPKARSVTLVLRNY